MHLGDEFKLMGYCVPFGHRVGKCTFLEYVSLNIYVGIGLSCQHLGDEYKLEGFLVPFGHRVGKYIFWDIIYFGK